MSSQEIQFELPQNIDRYLATLCKLYEKEGKKLLQQIIVNAKIKVHAEWSYDNWNGGTYGHAVYMSIPESLYLSTVDEKSELQTEIREGINKIHDVQNEFIDEVFFELEVPEEHDWRKSSGLLITHNKSVPAPVANRIWDKDCFRLFLSHKTEVKKETNALKEQLKKYGISSFVAHVDIQPTKEWLVEIENALHTMDAFAALLTEDFHDSLWTDQEVGFAFGRGVPIISLKLGRDPYGFIGKFQALSCTWQTAPAEIAKILIKKEHMLTAYLNAVHRCQYYDDGNNLSELLPFIDNLSATQVNKIIEAFNENSQIRDSYGFNGKKPRYYGDGLLPHLNRLTGKTYALTTGGKIALKKNNQ